MVTASEGRPLCVVTLRVLLAAAFLVQPLYAHEGHRPLPTRGMEVDLATGRMVLTRSARQTLDVQTGDVASGQLSDSVLAYGQIVSPWNQHALISSTLPGRIVSLNVAPGETVRAGQVLAELESPELELLQLELRSGQTELELSRKLVESAESASKSGGIAAMRHIEAKIKFQQDQTTLEITRAKWLSLGLTPDSLSQVFSDAPTDKARRLPLISPIDGIITHADLTIGKVIAPKEHVFEVLDLSSVWLKIGVLEKNLAATAAGQEFDFTATAYPGKPIHGKIDVLGQFLDPETHLGTVWASLSNAPQNGLQLLPGMSGQVRIYMGKSAKSLTLPLTAVIRDGAERFVLVEEEQTKSASVYRKQTVVLGRRMGGRIELRGGNVFEGDRVVTQGSHELGTFFSKGVLSVSPETARDIDLKVEPASPRPIAQTLTVDGLVDVPPTRRSVAASQLSGAIQRIVVHRGQSVAQGDVLAEIASQEFQSLQLDLLRSQLDAELQESTINSLRAVGDALPLRRLWEAESQWNQARSRRDSAKQRLKAAGVTEDQLQSMLTSKALIPLLPVRAPIAGVVTNFDKMLGHVTQADEPLFEVHDLSQVWIRALISERDMPQIAMGQQARVRLVANPREILLGTVIRSGRSLGAVDRSLEVWVELEQMPQFPVQHNLLAEVTVETAVASSELAVPRSAIVREGMRTYLFVQTPKDTFERRFVQVGRADDRVVEIRQGLTAGEPVAVQGAAMLQSGYAALR